jgi:hypothetical protein
MDGITFSVLENEGIDLDKKKREMASLMQPIKSLVPVQEN